MSSKTPVFIGFFAILVLAKAGVAPAAELIIENVSNLIITSPIVISAHNASGDPYLAIQPSRGTSVPGGWVYWLPAPVALEDADGGLVGRIEHLYVNIQDAPQISLNFVVAAADLDITFVVSSDIIQFPAITDPITRPSSGITITDLSGDGAWLLGGSGGAGKSFEAYVNPDAAELRFASLVSNVAVGPGGSVTTSEVFPLPVGSYSPVTQDGTALAVTTSMRSEFRFTLSALDVAGDTSVFRMISEPATLILLLAGGVVGVRRRRQRRQKSIPAPGSLSRHSATAPTRGVHDPGELTQMKGDGGLVLRKTNSLRRDKEEHYLWR